MSDAIPQTAQKELRFSKRLVKWIVVATAVLLISISAMLLFGWSIGSPQLLLVSFTSLIVFWLVMSIWQSRGQIRILTMLILSLLIAVPAGLFSRHVQRMEQQQRFIKAVTQKNGNAVLARQSVTTLNGWRRTKEGYVFPEILSPIYDSFAIREIDRLVIPADLVTRKNIESSFLSNDLDDATLILSGEYRDTEGLQSLCKRIPEPYLYVQADVLHDGDISYLDSIVDRKKIFLELKNPSLHTLYLASEIRSVRIRLDRFVYDPEMFQATDRLLSTIDDIAIQNSDCAPTLFSLLDRRERPLHLWLDGVSLTDAAWKELASMKNLVSLDIQRTNVSDAALSHFAGNKSIESMNLVAGAGSIQDPGIASIAQMEGLKNLYVAGLFSLQSIQALCRERELEGLSAYSQKLPQGGLNLSGRALQEFRSQ